MLARILDLAFALVYLRFLKQDGTGAYVFLVTFTTYLDTVVDFGLNALMARDVARRPDLAAAAVRGVNRLRFGLWLLALPLVAAVFGPARGLTGLGEDATMAGWIFYLALLPSVLAKTATGLLWAFERLEIPALVAVLAGVLKAVLGSAALVGGFGLVGLAASSLAINVASAALLVGASARLGGLPRRDSRVSWHAQASPGDRSVSTASAPRGAPAPSPFGATALARESWPLFVNQLLQGLFFKVDSLLLPRLAGLGQAGAYGAAYKVSEGAGVVSSSFTLAIFPRLSRQTGREGSDLSGAYRLSLRFLLQVALPAAAGISLLAEPIVGLVGGRAFLPDSAVALALLIWYLPFSYANGLTQYVLIAAGRQRFLTAAFLAAFAFNLVANLLLIPRYGFVAAALVTVASELVLLLPFRWAAHRVAPGVSLWREARAAVLAAALMAPVVWWARDAVHPLAAVAAGAAVYPAALWALGGIQAEQWVVIRSLLPAWLAPRPSPADPGRAA